MRGNWAGPVPPRLKSAAPASAPRDQTPAHQALLVRGAALQLSPLVIKITIARKEERRGNVTFQKNFVSY
jgi:hypothetical protein